MARRCCCCVNLVVDDDNTGSWSRTDDAINDISTITINRAVPLCNFQFGFAASHPNTSGGTVAIDGTFTIYFLSDPSDANVDAIGYITCNIVSPSSTVTRFWIPDNAYTGGVTPTIQVLGTGEVHIPAFGISNKTFYIDSSYTAFQGLSVALFNNKLMMSTSYRTTGDQLNTFHIGIADGCRIFTGTSTATCDAIGFPFVLNGTSCTAQEVYVRYVIEGDVNNPSTQFALNELNSYSGDRSCRTETAYYSEGGETGKCLSVPSVHCQVLPSEKAPFVVLKMDIADISVSKTYIAFTGGWTSISTPGKCDAGIPLDANDIFESQWSIRSGSRLEFRCDSGTVDVKVIAQMINRSINTQYHEWNISLPLSIEDFLDIPTTVLNRANATTYESTTGRDVVFTINP